jgi:hypothetical protein
MHQNAKIAIDLLKPDVWNTDHESYDMPEYMRIQRIGIYDASRIEQVEKALSLKSSIL